MDPAAPPAPVSAQDDDEWDAEGFEIPSLNTNKGASRKEKPVEISKPILHKPINTQTENLYLGPHGAKPGLRPQLQQQQQQDHHSSGRKQRFKQKLKDAEQRNNNGFGRENKVEILRDLMGSKSAVVTPRGTSGEWLDPHCHESVFDRSKNHHRS